MSKIIVAGVTQFESIVKVDKIPFETDQKTYQAPICFGGGGDAFNEASALTWLGDEVYLMSAVGRDQDVSAFNPPDIKVKIDTRYMLPLMKATPTEIIIFDKDQKQLIFEDIKDLRDVKYDMSMVKPVMATADCLLISNANFCRPFIPYAREAGKKIALNLRNYKREKEIYNTDFLENADIMYLSDDTIDRDPYEFVKDIAGRFHPEIIILGQGHKGLILYDRTKELMLHYNAVTTNEVVNRAGAGNALISGFVHYYMENGDSVNAIKNGLLCASYKTGFMRTSDGMLTPAQVEQWRNLIWNTQLITDVYGIDRPSN